jgi:hypothetical protein
VTYVPQPIDTSGVVVENEVAELVERLAKNTHEIWAQKRMRDGWMPGPRRDDRAKTHPCLVPYEELPDSEKQYDRDTVLGLFKGLIALGYTIERRPE